MTKRFPDGDPLAQRQVDAERAAEERRREERQALAGLLPNSRLLTSASASTRIAAASSGANPRARNSSSAARSSRCRRAGLWRAARSSGGWKRRREARCGSARAARAVGVGDRGSRAGTSLRLLVGDVAPDDRLPARLRCVLSGAGAGAHGRASAEGPTAPRRSRLHGSGDVDSRGPVKPSVSKARADSATSSRLSTPASLPIASSTGSRRTPARARRPPGRRGCRPARAVQPCGS